MSKTKETVKTSGVPVKRRRKKATMYHEAAVNALRKILSEITKKGEVTLEDEHRLSKQSMRIDMVLKKGRGVVIKRGWGHLMRPYNIIEYKSPVVPLPTLAVFNKVVYGYAGVYASQENISLIELTVTIICAEKPVALFKALVEELNYEILPYAAGIYYIKLKGVPIEKTLAIQVVVSSELPDSDILLKALKPGIDGEMAGKVAKIIDEDVAGELGVWADVVLSENINNILTEEDDMRKVEFVRALKKHGYYDLLVAEGRREGHEKGRQEGQLIGRQEGRQEGQLIGQQMGWERGILEGKRADARAMKAKNMDVATISQITTLPVEEIENL